ncbi:MAG: [FeFe] hydrogenase H-cluster radical SAM maturase HydE [Ruminiclostridium sp.]|nr:[FeFe] hydrogenase H-cluster radical SAM maturase HydE [Ruminiclostridium sp.]
MLLPMEMNNILKIIEKLEKEHSLTVEEYEYLIDGRTEETAEIIAEKARKVREAIYGKSVYIRGLIEISNICKNDCLYCGIRRSNKLCDRYRLSEEEILDCADEGYALGFRTFVMQGGEDGSFSDEFMCSVIRKLKEKYPDCAVTLSIGERSRESYERLFNAGANRFLLRHETADKEHYEKLHPEGMSFETRMECLRNLKEIGFQTGCGFMVGSPFQTTHNLALDLKFVEEFKPQMCGIGPFIPHKDTPFKDYPPGTAELTCYLLSIIRLIHPNILLPSTTALGTILDGGREKGILAGANVVMPNLSPISVRKKYMLYNGKISTGDESAEAVRNLAERMKSIGYEIVNDRGDYKE